MNRIQQPIHWKTAMKLGGAFVATCIGSGFATGSEALSFFVAHGMAGALGAILISLLIYFLFTRELFNKGQEVSPEDQNNILGYYFGKFAGEVLDWFSAILVGGCYLIMLNGAGTTLNQYLGWNSLAGAALSGLLGPVAQGIFVVMIILALYSTACPMMWGFCRKFTTDEKSTKYRICIIALTVLGMIATRLFRLGDLINFIYSISGYVGAVVLVGIGAVNFVRKYRLKKQT